MNEKRSQRVIKMHHWDVFGGETCCINFITVLYAGCNDAVIIYKVNHMSARNVCFCTISSCELVLNQEIAFLIRSHNNTAPEITSFNIYKHFLMLLNSFLFQ